MLRRLGFTVCAVHPRESEPQNEGVPCVPDLASLPGPIDGLSIVTPPAVMEAIVEEAAHLGIPRLWMQPCAESPAALARAEALCLDSIAAGACVLVELGC